MTIYGVVHLLLVVASLSQYTPSITVGFGSLSSSGQVVQAFAAPCTNPPPGFVQTASLVQTVHAGTLNCTLACPWDATCRPIAISGGPLQLRVWARAAEVGSRTARLYWNAPPLPVPASTVQSAYQRTNSVEWYNNPAQPRLYPWRNPEGPRNPQYDWYLEFFPTTNVSWATLDVVVWSDGWACPATGYDAGMLTAERVSQIPQLSWLPFRGTVTGWHATSEYSLQATASLQSALASSSRTLTGCLPNLQLATLTSPLLGYTSTPGGGVVCRPAYESFVPCGQPLPSQSYDYSCAAGLAGVVDPWSGGCLPFANPAVRNATVDSICGALTNTHAECVNQIILFEAGRWNGTNPITV